MKEDKVYDLQKNLELIGPEAGSRWKHYNGGLYRVVMKAVESNPPHRIKVIYKSEEFGYVWEHPIEEWVKMVEVDGCYVRRFTRAT